MVDGHVDMLSRDPGRVWQCWAEPLVGASILHNPAHAALARLEVGGFVVGRRDAEHRRPASRRRQRRRRGARPPAHGARACAAAPRRTMASALARYAETQAGARVPRVRRDAAPAGRALRRAAARLGLGPRLRCSSKSSGGCLCVGTSLQVYPAAGLAEAFVHAGGRSRSSRGRRRRSGRTPIRGCCARPRSSCPRSCACWFRDRKFRICTRIANHSGIALAGHNVDVSPGRGRCDPTERCGHVHAWLSPWRHCPSPGARTR